jgi:protein-tyrosine phosphatase
LNHKLTFPNLLNARDLGGYPLKTGGQTLHKSLLRSDELGRLTSEGVQSLLDYGVRTIIDLRWSAEAESYPSFFQLTPGHVRYVHISLLGQSEAAWRALRPEVTKEMWNSVMLEYAQPDLREVMRAVAQAPVGSLLFHCQSGKDRTGIIAALLLALAEVEPEAIAYDYSLTTNNLFEAYLAEAQPDEYEAVRERVRCPPEQIHNMLAHLEKNYGGPANYFLKIGLEEDEIARIRGRLRLG